MFSAVFVGNQISQFRIELLVQEAGKRFRATTKARVGGDIFDLLAMNPYVATISQPFEVLRAVTYPIASLRLQITHRLSPVVFACAIGPQRFVFVIFN